MHVLDSIHAVEEASLASDPATGQSHGASSSSASTGSASKRVPRKAGRPPSDAAPSPRSLEVRGQARGSDQVQARPVRPDLTPWTKGGSNRGVLEWLYTAGGRGGGTTRRNVTQGVPPLAPPPPTKVTIAGKNEFYRWEYLVGPLLVYKLLGPSPSLPFPPF